jgi:hypothetical protein
MLTSRSRILLEKLKVAPLVKQFLAFYGTRKSITMFTKAELDEYSPHPHSLFV